MVTSACGARSRRGSKSTSSAFRCQFTKHHQRVELGRGEPRVEELEGVRQHDRQLVARAHPPPVERLGETVRPGVELAVGPDGVAERQRRPLRRPLGRPRDPEDVHGPAGYVGCSSRPGRMPSTAGWTRTPCWASTLRRAPTRSTRRTPAGAGCTIPRRRPTARRGPSALRYEADLGAAYRQILGTDPPHRRVRGQRRRRPPRPRSRPGPAPPARAGATGCVHMATLVAAYLLIQVPVALGLGLGGAVVGWLAARRRGAGSPWSACAARRA